MSDWVFRAATVDDLPEILRIEQGSFSSPWTEGSLRAELVDDGRHAPMLVLEDGQVRGFALLWVVADERHLVNLAVDPAHRRRGIARALMNELIVRARAEGAALMTLEVRESNEAARKLYRHFGFLEIALRPNYYPDSREDAVVMLLPLAAEAPPDGR